MMRLLTAPMGSKPLCQGEKRDNLDWQVLEFWHGLGMHDSEHRMRRGRFRELRIYLALNRSVASTTEDLLQKVSDDRLQIS